jgi:hypothetical protein
LGYKVLIQSIYLDTLDVAYEAFVGHSEKQNIEKNVLDHIDLYIVLEDFASRM